MAATEDQQLEGYNNSEEEDNSLLPSQSEDNKAEEQSTDNFTLSVSSHQISNDSWQQVAFVLTTGVNSAYMLGYSATIMVPLGWIGGVLGLILANAVSLYASSLVAKLHELGGIRHIRYRDLAGHVYGDKAYALTWGLQYAQLFITNTGYIILAGQALKAACALFLNEPLKLPYCICLAGILSILFAVSVPDLSGLRIWLVVSCVLTIIYFLAAIVVSVNDGINLPPREYSPDSNFFSVIGASASVFFAFNTGMLPEIQATIRRPVVPNMMKALYFQFIIGGLPMFLVCFAGYWAYGSKTSTYLLANAGGHVRVKAAGNFAALFQSIISLHIFACPMYEFIDTYFGVEGSSFKTRNLGFRVAVRGGYVSFSTFVSALLPFLGDFMSLTGAVSVIPLTFVLANHMYMVALRNKLNMVRQLWHFFNVAFFSCFSFVAVVAACRLIAVDAVTYRFFADL